MNLTARASGLLPTDVYTIPEVSMAGETEETLVDAKVDYIAGRAPYFSTARDRIIGNRWFSEAALRTSRLEVARSARDRKPATELIPVGVMALLTGSGLELFDEACFNIPTLGGLKNSWLQSACPIDTAKT
jgi:NAD(P) transhydrogenase